MGGMDIMLRKALVISCSKPRRSVQALHALSMSYVDFLALKRLNEVSALANCSLCVRFQKRLYQPVRGSKGGICGADQHLISYDKHLRVQIFNAIYLHTVAQEC